MQKQKFTVGHIYTTVGHSISHIIQDYCIWYRLLILFEHQPQLVPYHFTGIEVKTLEFLIIIMLDDLASFEVSFTDVHPDILL